MSMIKRFVKIDNGCNAETIFTKSSIKDVLHGPKYARDSCNALRNLVSFSKFKKREKHPWGSVTLSKSLLVSVNLLKVTILRGYFSRFLNFTNETKSLNGSHR